MFVCYLFYQVWFIMRRETQEKEKAQLLDFHFIGLYLLSEWLDSGDFWQQLSVHLSLFIWLKLVFVADIFKQSYVSVTLSGLLHQRVDNCV